MSETILVLGANGQIGSELVETLRNKYGRDRVIASDIKDADKDFKSHGPFLQMDVLNTPDVYEAIRKNKVRQVYLMAAMLSATAEPGPGSFAPSPVP